MIVKEILLNALANAGHIHDGEPAEADDLELALRLFKNEMKILSNRNLICAYQKTFDISPLEKSEFTLGGYTLRKGARLNEVDERPSDKSKYAVGRDYFHIIGTDSFYGLQSGPQSSKYYVPVQPPAFSEYYPDVVCTDLERVVSVMFKDSSGQWINLRFVPLSTYYTEDDPYVYCTSTCGENRVKMYIPQSIVGKDIKIVYNSEMEFGKNETLELPDAHVSMVELAVTVAILRKDADSDPTRLNNYREQLQSVIDDISANTVTERRLVRQSKCYDRTALFSGSFIRR